MTLSAGVATSSTSTPPASSSIQDQRSKAMPRVPSPMGLIIIAGDVHMAMASCTWTRKAGSSQCLHLLAMHHKSHGDMGLQSVCVLGLHEMNKCTVETGTRGADGRPP